MKKPTSLPCTADAASMLIGNHGYEGYGTYIKLLQLIYKMPDQVLKKEHLDHVVNVNGMDIQLVETLLNNKSLFHEDQTRYAPVDIKVIHKKETPVENIIVEEHNLQKYIKKFFPRVSSLKDQMSVEQCNKIIEAYDRELIIETLTSMENYKELLKKYVNVYLTLNKWCKLAIERGWMKQKVQDATKKVYGEMAQKYPIPPAPKPITSYD